MIVFVSIVSIDALLVDTHVLKSIKDFFIGTLREGVVGGFCEVGSKVTGGWWNLGGAK